MLFFFLSNPSLSQVPQGSWHYNSSRNLGCESPALILSIWIISFGLPVAATEAGENSIAGAIKSSSPSAISGKRERKRETAWG